MSTEHAENMSTSVTSATSTTEPTGAISTGTSTLSTPAPSSEDREKEPMEKDMENASVAHVEAHGASGAQAKKMNGLAQAREIAELLRARARHDVMGRDDVIELCLIALLSGGHVLLEDYPGSGKTTLARAFGEAIGAHPKDPLPAFRRVQFTPDMLPSDVTGVSVFDPERNRFELRRGPVFSHVLLIDEINRTSPKVQAALLEAMAERQVTIDNETHPLDTLFFVIATQNPLDSAGTYPLPVAQLDRFLFKISMEHIDRDSELEVLAAWGGPRSPASLEQISRASILKAREQIQREVSVSQAIHRCLVDLARALRADRRCAQGVSTRALVQAIPALQVRALLQGRDFVSGDDVEALAFPLLAHRMTLIPGADVPALLIEEALQVPLEALSRATLSASRT